MGTSRNGLDMGNLTNSAFSPPTIAIITVVAVAFLVVTCYKTFYRRCLMWMAPPHSEEAQPSQAPAPKGIGENRLIRMAIYRYRQGHFPANRVDCAVCLLGFIDGDALRVLPTCGHAFHAVCVDAWLSSNTSCPLCRADVAQVDPEAWSHVHRFASEGGGERLDGTSRGFACICEHVDTGFFNATSLSSKQDARDVMVLRKCLSLGSLQIGVQQGNDVNFK